MTDVYQEGIMGLDVVELVLGVEETFGISIGDNELKDVSTVGDFYEFILNSLKITGNQTCMSSKVFYILRRGLIPLTGMKRQEITPDSNLSELMPIRRRRRMYRQLGRAIELQLPKLRLPERIQYMISWTMVVEAIALIWLIPFYQEIIFVSLISLAALLVISYFMLRLLFNPFCTDLSYFYPASGEMETLGDLTKETLSINFKKFQSTETDWNPDNVWIALKEIIIEINCSGPEEVTKEARFVEDLNFG